MMQSKNILDVIFFDNLIGYLYKEEQELIFYYDKTYLKKKNAQAISISLPLTDKVYKGVEVEAFFAGFLPEAEIRTLLAKKFGISEENDFSFLNKLGGECAGAISISNSKRKKERKLISKEDLEKYFLQIPQKALLSFQGDRRLSLAGAQHKLVILKKGKDIFFPASDEFSSHILKPIIHGYPNSVHNEYFCMLIAKKLGFNVPKVKINYAGKIPYLLIERYDRSNGKRLHQEDFSQALGILSKYKYQDEGGPGYKDCFNLLRNCSNQAARDSLKLLELIIFNFLIANNDAHAKNFSLLYEDTKIGLAPCYDLLCTAIYPDLSSEMAMKLGKTYKCRKVRPSDWERLADEININKKFLAKKLNELNSKILQAAKDLAEELQVKDPSEVYDEIIEQIKERSKYLL